MPKKFKKLFGASQSASKMDLDELLGRLPQGTPAQQLEARLMFERLAAEQAERYAPVNPATERGNAALDEIKQMVAPKNPDITKAKGGLAHMAGGGKALRKAMKGASRVDDAVPDIRALVDANRPLTAAERAMVGRLAAEYTANQPVIRLSEALGNVGAEGKKLRVTQTDRTGAKYLGGAPFSMMQKVDPRYAEPRATWGVKTRGAATNIINQSDPDVIWSTLIGSKTQHRSNELIFDKLYKAFQKSAKEGNLSTELRTKFNAALEPIFGEGADILDPKLRKEIDTFEKRAIVGNLLLGKDIGGATRGGSIIPGLKIMSETTEPMLKGVETFSIGPRLFTLDQGVITRPDLHPAFPEILTGQDLNQLFTPVPNRIALPTFNEDFRARTGRKKPGYYELTNTPEGDPYPTQFVDEDYLNFLQKEGYAKGGPVHMAGGNEPGESIGEMFNPKPLTIPAPLTDMADAIRRQFSKEKRTSQKPGAATDVILGGHVAPIAGAPGDFLDDLGQILDHVQKTHPLMREKASVMDTGPERTPPMGYAPKIRFSAEGNAPYGSEQIRGGMERYGLISDERRPLLEIGTSLLAPFGAVKALKYGKALAPTAADIMETQLLRATEPMRMNIVPDGGPSGKLKAPANDLGFYNPAEKAALNLQRKKGTGATFVSDLKKQPGVNDERLAELGLGDLASRPNVTKDELIAAADQNRIPLRETVRTEGGKTLEELNDDIYQLKEDMSYMDNDSREWAEADRALTRLEREYKQEEAAGRAMFGPKTHADYNMPGGKNYREIRVGLPSNRPSIKDMPRDQYNAAVAKADAEGVNDFTNSVHHGDEPNVLFHLRVADHTDAEGKKGLLIDELQSDWHQQGRDKGYGDKLRFGYSIVEQEPGFFSLQKEGMSMPVAYGTKDHIIDRARYYNAFEKGVPDAPFKDNWYQLGLKRAIKEAADTGMDRVYLTTGQRQADRYDLSKQVKFVEVKPAGNNKFEIYALDKSSEPIPNINQKSYSADELPNVIGKELADKALTQIKETGRNAEFRGLDLKVGGEGMRQYYDKTYKNFLDKYAKQFGATVGETTLPSAGRKMIDLSSKEIDEITSAPGFIREMMKLSGGKTAFQMSDNEYRRIFDAVLQKMRPEFGEKVYYIDITPKMRESAQKGQSYKDGGAVRMAEGGAVDYESVFNQMLQDHVGMAQGGAVDYESRFNDMLQKHVQSMAEGGAVNPYNEDPDMSDGGQFIQAPAFADGGAVKSIWTVN
jgi:hypothetical protein